MEMLEDVARVFSESGHECTANYDGWKDWPNVWPPKDGFLRSFSAQNLLINHEVALATEGKETPESADYIVVGNDMKKTIKEFHDSLKTVFKTASDTLGFPPSMPVIVKDMWFKIFEPKEKTIPLVAIPIKERNTWICVVRLIIFAAKIQD